MIKLIIRTKHDKSSPRNRQREKHLFCSFPPDLRVRQSVGSSPSFGDEKGANTLQRAFQGTPIDEQGNQEEVGEGGSEVDNLATGFDTLDEAGKNDDPWKKEA